MKLKGIFLFALIGIIVFTTGYVNITHKRSLETIGFLLNAIQPQSITINDGEKVNIVKTTANNVAELLAEQHIELDADDITIPPQYYTLKDLSEISIIRIDKVNRTEEVELEPQELRIPDKNMFVGEMKIIDEGALGKELQEFEVVLANKEQVSHKLISSNTLTLPKDRVVSFGAKDTIEIDGKSIKVNRALKVEATAYTAGYESTGKTPNHPEYGITASGLPVKRGHIAVDPSVIPMHSKVFIQGCDEIGQEYSGFYTATDTGGAIKGKEIDIYMEHSEEAYRFGRRPMKVYLIK